jgi:nucleotide-binding universal stress UspA family protein
VSSVRRVIVGVSGSPSSLLALRYAAGMARTHEAPLVPVIAWSPPGGDLADRNHPSPYLRQIWIDAAGQRLHAALEMALGGVPTDLAVESQVVRGDAGAVLVNVAAEDGDLLVVGAGRRGALRRALACRVSRYCVAHAHCPVVAVPPPTLARLSQGLRGWAFRHRGLTPEAAGLRTAH